MLTAVPMSRTAAVVSDAVSPKREATSPHTSAPSAWAPINTTRYIARPRACTHCGRDSCAATVRVVGVAMPRHPGQQQYHHTRGERQVRRRKQPPGVDQRRNREQCVGRTRRAESGHHKNAEHGPTPTVPNTAP